MLYKKALTIILSGVLVFGTAAGVFADELEDLQNEQANTEGQLDQLNNEIDDLEYRKTELMGQISETDQQLVLTLAAIETLNQQIAQKEEQLKNTEKELKKAQKVQDTEYEAMKNRMQFIYEKGGDSGWLMAFLSDSSIVDLLTQAEYTQKMYDYDRNCLAEYTAIVGQTEALKEEQTREKTELELMRTNEQEQQAHLEETLASMNLSNEEYAQQLASAGEKAAEYSQLLNEQNDKIQEILEERERQRQEEEARKAAEEEARRQAEEEEARRRAEEEANNNNGGGDDNGGGGGGYSEPSYDVNTGNAIVDRAYGWLGRAEYVWGGCSPGAFDCSGFVSYCVTGSYSRIGTANSFMCGGTPVSDPQPGDVCASSHHCGIYLGDGQMIHCSDYGIGVIIGPVQSDMIIVRL